VLFALFVYFVYNLCLARQGSDAAVAALVRLLIIDEVHLLNDERGPVIETLVARTQRQVRLQAAQNDQYTNTSPTPCLPAPAAD